ncbi:MAG TPA: ATP-binding protein [Alphaproteobacteria bacterium]|jgi:signal transduction histidine kinase|nr:ATP-binding protein [Alphaproteobacteria bacterium]
MSTTPLFLRTLIDEDLPEFETEVRVRQIVDLARQTPFHAVANVGNGILLASVFWDRLSHPAIVAWLGIFVGFSLLSLYRWWRKRRWPAPPRVSRAALQRTTFSALIAGLLWAAAMIYAYPRDDISLQMIILFLAGGLGSGAVGTMPSQPVACAAFMWPPLFSALALLATQGGEIAHVFTLMGSIFIVVLVAALASGFTSFATIVRTRFDSRTLETRLLEMELAASTEANAAKSQFLANMSHELRTPLNAVIGFSEIIRDQSLGPQAGANYREYANDIHAAGEHLLRIINDVLDISKIEAGKLELQESETDIRAIVRSGVKLMTQTAFESGVALETAVPDDLPMVMADELRLRQALMNLLSNAVKFSNRGGTVTVGAGLRPDGAMAIWVADTGIGMSENEITTALQPFRQVANSLSRAQNGIGVGLSLVDGIVGLHGGRLELTSAPAQGTTVTVVLPVERVIPA